MQYKYYYTTRRRVAGHKEFDDLFEAIHYMNDHTNSTFGVLTAVIINMHTKEIVCSKRKIG